MKLDCVFIDNEELNRRSWKMLAKCFGRNIAVFSSIDEFLAQAPAVDRSVPVFVDSDLGEGVPPGEVASKAIADLGFGDIYLATGHSPEGLRVRLPIWIKGIIGKSPPPWFTTRIPL